MKKILKSLFYLLLPLFLLPQCEEDKKDNLAALLIDPSGSTNSISYQFYGKVDENLTSSCGETSTASSKVVGIMADDDSSTTTSIYDITSYYLFNSGESALTFNYPINKATLYMKYKYNSSRDTFSLTPETSSTTTCYTQDYIYCNGSSGDPTCETADSSNCGGTYTFIFISENPEITFQGETGTIDWSEKFSLDSSASSVSRLNMTFSMISSDGTFFDGEVECDESDL